MVTAAAHWYTSGTFWAATGVAVALLIGIPTFLVAWTPRQRLYYAMPTATPLLSTPSGMADLELRHRGRRLTAPYLVEVTLRSQGRHDIPSSAFDRARPLVFDLRASVIEVLPIVCDPPSAPKPPVEHEGRLLKIGPELIFRGQTITIPLLLDAGWPRLDCTESTLIQVTVAPQPERERKGLVRAAAATAMAGCSLTLALTARAAGPGGRGVGTALIVIAMVTTTAASAAVGAARQVLRR